MNDWNMWLNSNETRTVLRSLEEIADELREMITNGSHIIDKSIDKIALDYTYSIGQLDGMNTMINQIKDASSLEEETVFDKGENK